MPCVERKIAAEFDDRFDFGGVLVDDAQRDRTVLQVHAVADRDVGRQVAIAHAHSLARPGNVVDRQDEPLSARERHRIHAVGKFSGAHFRTGKILNDRRLNVELGGDRAGVAMTSACSPGVPWEKFRRKTFTPETKSERRIARSREAGPTVATIFVRF